MSNRWPGGLIRKTPVTPAGPFQNGAAPGMWSLADAAYWTKQGLWPNANISAPDASFPYVTMLMSTTATNAQQNNTFLDSSTNNFTITRNGNTTQGSANPYGPDWANYFDGSGDYLTVPSNTAFAFGTGDYTLECWINTNADNGNVIDLRVGGNLTPYPSIYLSGGSVFFWTGTGSDGVSVGTYTKNAWVHLAVSRSGSSLKFFINGAQTYSASNTTNLSQGTVTIAARWDAAAAFAGYMSNVRIVKGTAVYTSAFTPPTAPLTAITNTSLLTCQSNRFRDNSTNNFTITVNGNTAVTPFSPFSPAYPGYTAAANGGSGYFDGSGDYLSYPEQSGDLGTADWTLECWAYPTATPPNYASLLNKNWTFSLQTGDFQWSIKHDNGYMSFAYNNSGIVNVTTTIAPVVGAWTHYAVTRSGTTLRIYANGVLNTTATLPAGLSFGTASTTSVFTGYNSRDGSYYTGYINDLRVVAGTALYTGSTYTVPTAPLTAITNTSLLLSTTNAGIFDAAAINNMETVGNAQVSTVQAKFGTTSFYVPSGGGSVLIPNSQALVLGSGNWTVEFWAYTDASGTKVYFDALNAANTTYQMEIYSAGTSLYWVKLGGTVAISATGALTANTWQHIAACKSGSSTRLFVNGTQVGSTYTDTDTYDSARWEIGGRVGLTLPIVGYIDDLRITKGVARYTANFTPPTQAFPAY